MRRSPTVVACGVCCDGGIGADSAWRAAFAEAGSQFSFLGDCGIFKSPKRFATRVGAIKSLKKNRLPRCGQILNAALADALKNVSFAGIGARRIGVYCGTSVGGILESEDLLADILKSENCENLEAFKFYECSTLAELVAKHIGARGECATFSTACSSSSLALESACLAISEGRIDAAIVCGADSLSRITVNGFGSLMLLSASDCRPFDENRDGINLGEAGGVMIIFAEEFAGKNKRLAEFKSFGSSCDAYHPTAPNPHGEGAKAAIELCLKNGNINPSEVDFYCAHGTGTKANDSAECEAIADIFKSAVPPFFSVKSIFGHTLGASGILNAIIAVKALEASKIPPSAGYFSGSNPQPAKASVALPKADIALAISLGFGGNNSCAAIAKSTLADSADLSQSPKDIFIFGAGCVCANADLSKPISDDANLTLDADKLLADMPILKKRKWAKLQRMFLQATKSALKNVVGAKFGACASVSCATGLGMVAETQRFVESAIISQEEGVLPTAFTNSVHNAPASLLAIYYNCQGYNCATTAKEISFEAALMEACARIRHGDCVSSLVAGGDECNQYAQMFVDAKCGENARRKKLSDACASYFIGTRDACDCEPCARVLKIDLRRCEKSPDAEAKRILSILSQLNLSIADIGAIFCPAPMSGFKTKFLKQLEEKLGDFVYLENYVGRNYSASAFGGIFALSRGRGVYMQYSLSSTSMAALTILEVL